MRRLDRAARTEFDDAAPGPDTLCNLAADVFEKLGLDAGRVIFGLGGDILEQLGPARVVEPARGDRLLPLAEAGEDVIAKIAVESGGIGFDKAHGTDDGHAAPFAG